MMGSKPVRVPIFPLAGALLFPRAQLPLQIFEERYREMVRDALAGPGRIAMIQPSLAARGERPPPLFRAGCLGEIVGVEELDDGRFNIVLQGSHRFRLIAEPTSARLTARPMSTSPRSMTATRAVAADPAQFGRARGAQVRDALGLAVDWDAVGRLDDEMLVNAIAQVAPFDPGGSRRCSRNPGSTAAPNWSSS